MFAPFSMLYMRSDACTNPDHTLSHNHTIDMVRCRLTQNQGRHEFGILLLLLLLLLPLLLLSSLPFMYCQHGYHHYKCNLSIGNTQCYTALYYAHESC